MIKKETVQNDSGSRFEGIPPVTLSIQSFCWHYAFKWNNIIIEYYLSMEYFPYLVQLLEYCDYVLICNICGYVCINRTLDYDYEYYLYT